jgi:hypothetical protein
VNKFPSRVMDSERSLHRSENCDSFLCLPPNSSAPYIYFLCFFEIPFNIILQTIPIFVARLLAGCLRGREWVMRQACKGKDTACTMKRSLSVAETYTVTDAVDVFPTQQMLLTIRTHTWCLILVCWRCSWRWWPSSSKHVGHVHCNSLNTFR